MFPKPTDDVTSDFVMSVAVSHNQSTDSSNARWSPRSSSAYDVADTGPETTNAETGSQSALSSRPLRPKSAWKNRQRRPRFTDQLIVSMSNDDDGEIETLLLDEKHPETASGQRENPGAPTVDDEGQKHGNKLAPHPPTVPRPQRYRNEHTTYAGKIDPDWPSHISPLTPRAWQDGDVIANSAMRTTPSSDSRCSSGVETPDTVIELAVGTNRRPLKYFNDSTSDNRSSDELVEVYSDERTAANDFVLPPSGLPPTPTLLPVTSESQNFSKGPLKSPPSAIAASVRELEHIHQKVLDKYLKSSANSDAGSTLSPVSSTATHNSRNARSVSTQQSGDVAVASRIAPSASVDDNGDGAESRILLPVRKLAPIDQLTAQRNGSKIHRGEKNQNRIRKQRARAAAALMEPTGQSLDNVSTSQSETANSGHRKVKLKPLIGRRGKAFFDAIEVNGRGAETDIAKYIDVSSAVERGSTFTLPPSSFILSSPKNDDVTISNGRVPVDNKLLLSVPSTHLADPVKQDPQAGSYVPTLNTNNDYFRFPVDQLNNTNIDLSWTTTSFDAETSPHVTFNRPIVGENNERSKRLLSTSSSSFDENVPTVNSRTTRLSRDRMEIYKQFPESVNNPAGIQSTDSLRSSGTHAPVVPKRSTFANLPSDDYSSLFPDPVLDDVDLREFSLFARRPIRATRSLPLDANSTSASTPASTAADHLVTQTNNGASDVTSSMNRSRIPVRVPSKSSAEAKTDSQFPTASQLEPADGLFDRLGESFDSMSTSLTSDAFDPIASSLPFSLPSAPSLNFGQTVSSWNPQFSLTDMWKQLNVSSNNISPTDKMMSGYP